MSDNKGLHGHFQNLEKSIRSFKNQLSKINNEGFNHKKNEHIYDESIKQINMAISQIKLGMQSTIQIPARQIINQKFEIMRRQVQNNIFHSDDPNCPNDKMIIETWVGQFIKIAVEQAHKLYFKNGNQQQMRLAFATLVLEQHRKYTLQLSKIKKLKTSNLQAYFKNASDGAIEYLQYKFESSKGKAVDMSLSHIIKDPGLLIGRQYDMLRRSRTTLNLIQKSTIVFSIKKFINSLITQSRQKSGKWKQFVQTVFKVTGDVPMKMEQGTKIKMSTPTYDDQELKSQGFFVTGNQIMRILMKWIEELIDIFNNPDRCFNNSEGYRILNEYEMRILSNVQKEGLWGKLQRYSLALKKLMQKLNKSITKITSKIILVSQQNIQGFQYLDKNVLSMLLISENIWKSLENYMMDTMNVILQLFDNIREEYHVEKLMETDIQVYTFTLGDLLRCRCAGTKDQVLQVWYNLQDQQKKGKIKILRVKNRLNQATTDFLINFAFTDQKECFLICQMQIALKQQQSLQQNDSNHAYHFMHFLYEMARSPHGAIIQLAVKLYEMDNRKKFIAKHHLKFNVKNKAVDITCKKATNNFSFYCFQCQNKQEIQGKKNSKSIKYEDRQKTYICSNCEKLIPSCKYFFSPLKCSNPSCKNKLCPLCLIQNIDFQKAASFLIKDESIIIKYFKPIKCKFTKLKIPYINEILKQTKMFCIVYYKCFYAAKRIQYLKKVSIDNKQIFMRFFTNQFFNIEEQLKNSIVLILIPTIQPIKRQQIQQDFDEIIRHKSMQDQSKAIQTFYKKYDQIHPTVFNRYKHNQSVFYKITNQKDKKCIIINDDISKRNSDLQKNIAEQIMKQVVEKINQNYNNTKLLLLKMKSPQLLKSINDNTKIIDIEIEQAELQESNTENNQTDLFNFLNAFQNTQSLSIYKTPCYISHEQYKFSKCLKQLIIRQCNLSTCSNIQYPLLQKLDLLNNQLTQIPNFSFSKIQSINLSNNQIKQIKYITAQLPHLKRLILKYNKIHSLPIFNLSNLQYLNLSDNVIQSFDSINQFNTQNLEYLNLQNNGTCQKQLLKIYNLKKLAQLNINNCIIHQLDIIKLTNLKILKANYNYLSTLKISNKTKLKYIDISYNSIKNGGLSQILQNLSANTVQLYGNQFKQFPKDYKFKLISTIYVQNQKFENGLASTNENTKVSNDTQPSVCYNCRKQIKQNIMFYNTTNKKKVCQQDVSSNKVETINLIKIIRISGQYSNMINQN